MGGQTALKQIVKVMVRLPDDDDVAMVMLTMTTNHNDEVSYEDSSCGCDHGHDKAVEEAKKITWVLKCIL